MKKLIILSLVFFATNSFGQTSTKIEDDLCTGISRTVDDFTGVVKINSPYMILKDGATSIYDKAACAGIIYKYIDNETTTYYLSLRTIGSTVNVSEKGVIILFNDGTKIEKKNADISVDVSDGDYVYSTFIVLSKADLTMLSTKTIKKFRLFIYDYTMKEKNSKAFMQDVNCVINSK